MHTAILDAADALLVEGGYPAVTIEAVAARARVTRFAVSRRWPSRVAVVMAVVARREQPEVATGTGSLTGDVRAIARAMARLTARPTFGTVLPGILVDLADDPSSREALVTEWVSPWVTSTTAALLQAAERNDPVVPGAVVGAGRTDPTVVAELVELLVGPLLYRALLAGSPASPEEADLVADLALRALGPVGAHTDT